MSSGDTPADLPETAPRGAVIFWLSFWLAVALVGTKAAFLGLPSGDAAERAQHLRNVVIVSHQDLLFSVAWGLLAGGAVALSSRWKIAAQLMKGIVASFCVIFVLYAVASYFAFGILRAPLTYSLLYMANDMVAMRSSCRAASR
jgi:hypothetical protein